MRRERAGAEELSAPDVAAAVRSLRLVATLSPIGCTN